MTRSAIPREPLSRPRRRRGSVGRFQQLIPARNVEDPFQQRIESIDFGGSGDSLAHPVIGLTQLFSA